MENNIIVSEAYSDVRAMARNVMRSKWLGSALALLIYTFVCSNLPNMLGDMIPAFKRTIYLDFIGRYYDYSTFPGLYSIFIEAAFSLGLAMFILNFIRAGKVSIELIFGGFEKFIKAFLMNLVMSIITIAGLMLFIVPGIVFALMYSQAYFIMADNPELGAMKCLKKSRTMMVDNKGYLFGLRFSFIGWALLASISIVCGKYIMEDIMTANPVVDMLITTVLEIPMYFVLAYLQVTNGIFYELASGHIRPVVTPTYANMYGNLNQNMPGNNQGFNQNVSGNYNQGYGMQNPSVSKDVGAGEPQAGFGGAEAPVNESPANNTIANEVAASEVPNNNEGVETDVKNSPQDAQQDEVNLAENHADSDNTLD